MDFVLGAWFLTFAGLGMLALNQHRVAAHWKGEAARFRKLWIEENTLLMAERNLWKAKYTAFRDEVSDLGSKLFSLRLQHKPLPPEGREDA